MAKQLKCILNCAFQLQLSEEEQGSGSEGPHVPRLETADLPPISVNTSIQVDTLKMQQEKGDSSLLLASSAPDSGANCQF